MTFFDRKEEVLEIELTPYGRYLLSLGKLEPVYYAFFDDDVVYDSDYLDFSEDQNSTEGRVKETSRVHSQLKYRKDHFMGAREHNDMKLQNYFDKEYSLNSILGVADYYSDYAPAWEICVLKGEIVNTATVHSSSGGKGPNYMIPQINMADITYDKLAGTISVPGEGCSISDQIRPHPFYDEDLREVVEYEDGTFTEVRRDFVLLEVLENNTTFQKENFEMELFETTTVIAGGSEAQDAEGNKINGEILTSFKFAGPRRLHETEYVDYYFNLDVDLEIDERELCKYKGVDESKGIFLQGDFECAPTIPGVENPYRTDVVDAAAGICDDDED
jgi:hypothetical protein